MSYRFPTGQQAFESPARDEAPQPFPTQRLVTSQSDGTGSGAPQKAWQVSPSSADRTHDNGALTAVSERERSAVSERLHRQMGPWVGVPDYETFCRERSLQNLKDVYDSVRSETDADVLRVEAAYVASCSFVEHAFDVYSVTGTEVLG